MKWILAAMALSVSFMVGCQCTEKASEMPADQPAQMEPAPTEAEPAPADGTEMPAEGGTEGGTETPPAAE